MLITIAEDVRIEQVDDLTAFALFSTHTIAEIDARLRRAGLGYVADAHAWIDAEKLRTRASAAATSETWSDKFERMLEFARSHGWWDADRGTIRVHITTAR